MTRRRGAIALGVGLLVSPQVLDELEGALRRKAPGTLGLWAVLLDRSQIEVVPTAGGDSLQQALTAHPADARVVAAAWAAGVDFLVTLDQKHLLEAAALREAVPFPIATPGDFLKWFRGVLS